MMGRRKAAREMGIAFWKTHVIGEEVALGCDKFLWRNRKSLSTF